MIVDVVLYSVRHAQGVQVEQEQSGYDGVHVSQGLIKGRVQLAHFRVTYEIGIKAGHLVDPQESKGEHVVRPIMEMDADAEQDALGQGNGPLGVSADQRQQVLLLLEQGRELDHPPE